MGYCAGFVTLTTHLWVQNFYCYIRKVQVIVNNLTIPLTQIWAIGLRNVLFRTESTHAEE